MTDIAHIQQLIDIYKQSSAADNRDELIKQVNNLLADGPIKEKICANIETVFVMTHTSKNILFEKAADIQRSGKQSLVNALVIMGVVSHYANLTNDPQSFSTEMLKGGHVILNDNGELKKLFESINTTIPENSGEFQVIDRTSSHYKDRSIGEDYSFRSEIIFREFLFGSFADDAGKTHTWMQFESHALEDRTVYNNVFAEIADDCLHLIRCNLEMLEHGIDFLVYFFMHHKALNIAQYGNSPHSETHNPITISDENSHSAPTLTMG